MSLYESHLEEACLQWFARLGYEIVESDNLDPDSVYRERSSHADVVLEGRLRVALNEINDDLPEEAVEEAIRQLKRHDAPTVEQNNLDFHRYLTDGITVDLPNADGVVQGHTVRLFDTENPDRNDWLVCSQVTIVDEATGTGQPRRPDIVVWVNGIPLAVLELKNPSSKQADIWGAYNQIQTYKKDIPSLFATNELIVISDDVLTRVGSLTADRSRFQPWRAVEDEKDLRVPAERDALLDKGERLQALVEGVFEKERLLDLVHSFVTFEKAEGRIVKKLAAYHQFHAVRRAIQQTVRAAGKGGDGRVGVVWHTQGSGKSLTMVFYAGKLVAHPAMENPTLVVITDRNDLDDQLFGTFAQSEALLRQTPVQATSRDHLRELLKTSSGGVYFTTMQKFAPADGERAAPISERRNIIVIADEAHRSQYGLTARLDPKTGQKKYGLALHLRDALPQASFVGFTGTPVELEDKSTIQIFGNYISVYDIQRAVEDGATVPIYYESRLAKIELDEAKKPLINVEFEELTEDEEESVKEGLKSEWSSVEALVGAPERLALVAQDIVEHFGKRNQAMDGGKAMIVCMSRRICAALYEEIVRIRPDWHADEDDTGRLKVVMTGSASDVLELKKHLRSKRQREAIAERFKDPKDDLQLVIVRDMWLTGFDAPCMHTLYVDKPMRGHNLMQAIARVNRVYGDKPGGLVVDYLGVAGFLKEAMHTYTQSGGQGDPTRNEERAVELMQEKLEICRELFHGLDYQTFFSGTAQQRLDLMPAARQYILSRRKGSAGEGKQQQLDDYDRFMKTVAELSKAAAICSTSAEFEEVRDEVAFFQAVKAGLVKLSPGRKTPISDLSYGVRQIVESAVVSDQVVDVFDAAGLEKPDVAILSEEFLAEVLGMRHKDLAAAALERILRDQIRQRGRTSVVQARSFEEMLEEAVNRYLSRSIETAQLIQELIELARKMRDAALEGEKLGLTKDEFAFYEALAENASARNVMGDEVLSKIAHELTATVRQNTSIDWTRKQSIQAKLRLLVKKLLNKYGYPPDAAKRAIETVLQQAERMGINVTDGIPEQGVEEEPPASTGKQLYDLPYPIAVFDGLLRSQEEASLRVKTQLDAFERAFTFLVVCELGWIRSRGDEKCRASAEKLVEKTGGKRVSMGTWLELAWQLAALLPVGNEHPVVRAARHLVTDKGKPSDLTKMLQADVVPLRNDQTHGVSVAEEALQAHEVPLRERWTTMKAGCGPLRELQLVSKAKVKDFAPNGSATYNLRFLTGASELFAIDEAQVQGRLEENWGYLFEGPSEPPISLVPFVRVHFNGEASRREVLLPRTLVTKQGAQIELWSVLGGTTEKIAVP